MKTKKPEIKVKWTFLNHPSQQAIEDYNKIIARGVKRALLRSKEIAH
jgi:hypothetical protein